MSYGSVNYGFAWESGPGRPGVVPRVRLDDGSSSLPAERLFLPMLRAGVRGLVVITAPAGGGKTTTLQYLQAMLPADGVQFFDQEPGAAREASRHTLAILVDVAIDSDAPVLMSASLSQWTLDDCIEYLAGRHREQLARILKLLSKDDWLPMLKGSPQLLAMVMEAMAADESLHDAPEALRAHLGALNLPAGDLAARSIECYLTGKSLTDQIPEHAHVLRHEAMRRAWVAHVVATELSLGRVPPCLSGMKTQPLLGEIAAAVAGRPAAIQTLEKLIADDPADRAVAMAASILLRLDAEWRPEDGMELRLAGAVLRGAKWGRLDLKLADLGGADLSDADLGAATIGQAARANFTNADLQEATLKGANLEHAKLIGANLSEAVARKCDLSHADCQGADFSSADFGGAKLEKTNLSSARLHSTFLGSARLIRTKVEGAHFEQVDFTRATLRAVRLNKATWNSPIFRRARLRRCNLEGLELPDADFAKADLTGSLFTGSRIPRGKFAGAILAKAGLAEIEWDDADLRDADFTNASFHLGSSRSGLVGSTIPSEGSRTGFYTDEFTEQDFKTPEEIRKACLCGANLVGALVEKTDFYLVDLRGAKYTRAQARHFRGCGAILVTKVR